MRKNLKAFENISKNCKKTLEKKNPPLHLNSEQIENERLAYSVRPLILNTCVFLFFCQLPSKPLVFICYFKKGMPCSPFRCLEQVTWLVSEWAQLTS